MTRLQTLIFYKNQLSRHLEELAEPQTLDSKESRMLEIRLVLWQFSENWERFQIENFRTNPRHGLKRALLRHQVIPV